MNHTSTSSLRPGRSLVYLGWHGFGNFGDDLLHETWKLALDTSLDRSAPLYGRDYLKQGTQFLRDRLALTGQERLILLGGGTTIGFENWAGHAKRAINNFGAKGILIPGAGAATREDSFAHSLQASGWDHWKALGQKAALLGVRGPLTAKECGEFWKPARVIGDPALLYPKTANITANTTGPIGICLGADPDTRFNINEIAPLVIELDRLLGNPGIEIFQLSASDASVSNQLATALGSGATIHRYEGNVRHTMERIAGTRLFISERLHGAVASVALGVPTVPLAYASKCDDFWSSISDQLPAIHPGSNIERLIPEALAALEPARQELMNSRVHTLQGRLEESASRIRNWLQGKIATEELLSVSNKVLKAKK